MSPCINICSLDEQGYCRGCYRSRDEIGRWISMTPGEQWAVLRAIEARRGTERRAATG